ncbi:MAG TPA: hypothetical protein EYH31_11415 [Anaerolineae bacterium]|nr:hypothetical protein [Anaerolineae bacterium]
MAPRTSEWDWCLDAVAISGLALAVVGFFWRLVVGSAWMPADGGDLVSFLYPTYHFLEQNLRRGTIPLWNPHLYGGAPFVADIQSGLFYPPNWLLFLLPGELNYTHMQWMSIAHIWWAGTTMYLFLRSLGPDDHPGGSGSIGRMPALAGALAFMFSDGFLIHFGNLNLIAVASWMPLVFLAYRRALNQASFSWAVDAGLLLGVATLAGHIQITLFILLALALYSAVWIYLHWSDWMARGTAYRPGLLVIGFYVITLLISSLLAALILLPAVQLSHYTERAEWDYIQSVAYSLAPAQWIGFLIPGFFGREPQLHWGLWERVEVGYLGILPLWLALLALLAYGPADGGPSKWQRQLVWTWLAVMGSAFLIALGPYSIVHGWATRLIPGFGQLRAPARLALVVDFGLAVLAALGLSTLVKVGWEKNEATAFSRVWRTMRLAAAALFVFFLPLVYLTVLTGQDRDPVIFLRISVAAIAVALFAGLLLASMGVWAARHYRWARPSTLAALAVGLIFLDLASNGAYMDLSTTDPSHSYRHPAIVEFLQRDPEKFRIDARTGVEQLWQPDTALLYGLDDVWGVANPSVLADYKRYWEGMGGRSSRLYDFLNVKYVIGHKDVQLDTEKFKLVFNGDPELNVYRNEQVLPRVFVVHQAIRVLDQAAAWDAIHAPDFDPGQAVVIEGEVSTAEGHGQSTATIVHYTPNEIVVDVSSDSVGYLVLSEVWYPGWQAYQEQLDGARSRRVPLYRANYTFRAVAVQPGQARYRFVFQPRLWYIGLGSSLLVVGCWLLVTGYSLLAARFPR